MGPAKAMLAFARARSSPKHMLRFGAFSPIASAARGAASTPRPSPALSKLTEVSLKDFTRIANAMAGSRLGQPIDINGRGLSLSSAQFETLLRNIGYTGDTGAVFAEMIKQTGAATPSITTANMHTLYQTSTYTADSEHARKALVAKVVSTFHEIDTDGSVSLARLHHIDRRLSVLSTHVFDRNDPVLPSCPFCRRSLVRSSH